MAIMYGCLAFGHCVRMRCVVGNAIQFWHLNVHQNYVKCILREGNQCLYAIAGNGRFIPQALQHA